jgi:nucleotide-binding universal stress UspA family protein
MSSEGKQVIVGVDGSEASIEALRWAVEHSDGVGGTVKAIRTWHYPWAMQTAPAQVDESLVGRLQGELADAVKKAGLEDKVELAVMEGHASIVLVRESSGADLLVVGSHGHSAARDLFLGSTTLHCVAKSTCPVVVVRAP